MQKHGRRFSLSRSRSTNVVIIAAKLFKNLLRFGG
jgi:hypothetical protein